MSQVPTLLTFTLYAKIDTSRELATPVYGAGASALHRTSDTTVGGEKAAWPQQQRHAASVLVAAQH